MLSISCCKFLLGTGDVTGIELNGWGYSDEEYTSSALKKITVSSYRNVNKNTDTVCVCADGYWPQDLLRKTSYKFPLCSTSLGTLNICFPYFFIILLFVSFHFLSIIIVYTQGINISPGSKVTSMYQALKKIYMSNMFTVILMF